MMSALDELLKELDDHYNDPIGMVEAARAELAALRDTITESCALIDTLNTTIAMQAQQLEEARKTIEPFAIVGDVFVKQDPYDDSVWTKLPDNQMVSIGWSHLIVTLNDFRRASAWLAANAPAPQAQPEQ